MNENIPSKLRYTKDHEWVELIDETHARIGITDYAQAELGDVVYVELPEVGTDFEQTETFGSVESVKAVSDLYMPLGGKVTEVNGELEDQPELVNNSSFVDGWMLEIEIAEIDELDTLMGSDDYEEFLKSERIAHEDSDDDEPEGDEDRG